MVRVKGSKNVDIRTVTFMYPANGFQSDVEIMLQKFLATNGVRFEEFSKIWRECDFSLIHAGRNGKREKVSFLEEAFKIIIQYILPPYNIQIRVGGLYLLYGMYHSQKVEPKIRIRMALSNWKDFLGLLEEVKSHGHLDAAYIGHKLLADRAFQICAFPSPLCVDELFEKSNQTRNPSDNGEGGTSGLQNTPTILSQAIDEEYIGQLDAVHEKYHSLKCQQNSFESGIEFVPSSSLDLIKPNLTKPLQEIATSTKKKSNVFKPKGGVAKERAAKLKAIKERAATGGAVDLENEQEQEVPEPASVVEEDDDEVRFHHRGRPFTNAEEVVRNAKRKKLDTKSGDNGFVTTGGSGTVIADLVPTVPEPKSKQRVTSPKARNTKPRDKSPKRKRPKSRSGRKSTNSTATVTDETGTVEKAEQIEKKEVKKSEPVKKELMITVNQFVALKPGDGDKELPLIAKVAKIIDDEKIEVEKFIGSYTTLWTSLALIKEYKEPIITIDKSSVVLAGFTLTKKDQKIPVKIRNELKKIYENLNNR